MGWRIRLQVRYSRRTDLALTALALVALLAGLLGALAWTPHLAVASPTQAQTPISLQYYLTVGSYSGDQALSACAPGYHMAALWEILDTSNLRYNTTLGRTSADNGQGPPYGSGWIRTGFSSDSTGAPGTSNCLAWTTGSASYIGTTVSLPSNWIAGEEDLLGWNAGTAVCSVERPVWCVGRNVLFLPLILRN